jgi:hypothetical protein
MSGLPVNDDRQLVIHSILPRLLSTAHDIQASLSSPGISLRAKAMTSFVMWAVDLKSHAILR